MTTTTGNTIRCRFPVRPSDTRCVGFGGDAVGDADPGGGPGTCPPRPRPRPVSRAARMLALAHHINSLVEEGKLASYAAAADALGLTRARLTQVMNLLLLAPEVQERILIGGSTATERALRKVSVEVEWGNQAAP